MPYPILDAIEKAAIRDKQTPVEVFFRMQAEFPGEARSHLGLWVERFFRLWCRNQWKRERYAPSFHLDDENLDPKTWCRFPSLSGGFEMVLGELARIPQGFGTMSVSVVHQGFPGQNERRFTSVGQPHHGARLGL